MPRCIRLREPGKLSYDERDTLTSAPGEAVLNMHMAAVCGSDYSTFTGHFVVPLPVVTGHEGVGTVESVGSGVTNVKPGDKVVINPNVACDTCELCRNGMRNMCSQKVRIGIDADGVFADQARIKANYLYPVPRSLPDEHAVLVEPYAVAVHALSKVDIQPGQRVLIIGSGSMGLMLTQILLRKGIAPVCYDLEPIKIEKALSIGARDGASTPEKLEQLGLFDVIFESSGAPMGLDVSIKQAAPGASIVLLGLPSGEYPVLSTTIVRKELKIFGSIIYVDEFPEVIRMLSNKEIQPEQVTSDILAFEELASALENFKDPHRVKMLIRIRQ